MSTVYATEPSPSGRIVLETTHGPLDIELWCRECPRSTRFLMQLVLDGYFDNNVFHRILSNTLIQCGAIRYSPETKASDSATGDNDKPWNDYRNQHEATAALERQRFELNSRLRFSHRGMVALALPVEDAVESKAAIALQPQFFITLQDTPYLDGKHVILGRVTGPTVFNALRIGRTTPLDEENPDYSDAPRITGAKVVENTIHTDLKPTALQQMPWRSTQNKNDDKKKKKRKRKGKLDVNVLSFGDELGGQEDPNEGSSKSKKRIKSVHENDKEEEESEKKHTTIKSDGNDDGSDNEKSNHDMLSPKIDQQADATPPQQPPNEPEPIQKKAANSHAQRNDSNNSSNKDKKKKKNKLDGASLLQAMRAKSQFSTAAARAANPEKKSRRNDTNDRDQATMSKLMAFQTRLGGSGNSNNGHDKGPQDNSLAARMARKAQQAEQEQNDSAPTETYHGQVLEDHRSATDASWMSTKFQCRKHMDLGNQDVGGDGRHADEYQVVDDRSSNDKERKTSKGDRDGHGRHHRHHYRHSDHKRRGHQDRR